MTKEILRQIFDRCDHGSGVNYNNSKLWFVFRYGSLMLELEYKERASDDILFSYADLIDIDSFCDKVSLSKLYITDPEPYTEDEKPGIDTTWKMMQMVKAINVNYPDAIKAYHVEDFLMDDCMMCGENWWRSYFIEISEEYQNDKTFIEYIIELLGKKEPRAMFAGFITKDLEIATKYDIKLLTTNTKVRRLGYFKMILRIFKENSLQLVVPFFKRIGETALGHESELLAYKNSKGIIKPTKTGSGAKPYVEVATDMNLITKVGNGYELGKVSRAYNAFLPEHDTSIFEMGMIDRAFFMESILRYDFLYIYTLLEYAITARRPSYKDAKGVYQKMLLTNLQQMIEDANRADSIKKYNMKVVEQRIRYWRRPEIYLEHVLMPRLNWLYDLDLISLYDNLSFDLTEKGERLFLTLCQCNDLVGVHVADAAPFLDAMFMKMFDFIYGRDKNEKANIADVDSLLSDYLEESFTIFKTFAPNRVTFSVFANYAKWKLYKDASVAVDTDDIKDDFLKRNSDKLIFKFQEFYNDGYIQKIK